MVARLDHFLVVPGIDRLLSRSSGLRMQPKFYLLFQPFVPRILACDFVAHQPFPLPYRRRLLYCTTYAYSRVRSLV